jgi:copper transport protein
LTILIIFLSLIPSFNIVETSYSQITTIGSESETAAAITSYTDAIIKGPLLIAQALIVGITVIHSFVLIPVIKKDSVFNNNNNNSFVWSFLVNNKQFIITIIVCGAIIFNMSLIFLVYQASLLSSELALDLSSTFLILLSTSAGNIFIIKLATSTIIIILSIVYYYYIAKKTQRWKYKEQQNVKHQKIKTNNISLTFCLLILILGSINIFTNSIQSHNAAVSFLPYLAIFIDWIHFMMVSIWVGGLFYISLLISRKLLVKEKIPNIQYSNSFTNSLNIHLFLSIILRFSIIAIMSMGIIFITGLYMGLLHLQQPSSLLNSPYGNILIIKLLLVFPMGLLGGYHHFRLHKFINQKIWIQINQQLQKFKIFDKSLKLEFIFGIGIIFTSSFLTITSPPQQDNFHNMDMMTLPHFEQSESTKNTNNQNHLFDQSFSFITLLLSISIAILVILFARQGWLNLQIYNQNSPK